MTRVKLIIAALLLFCVPALAQQPVFTFPLNAPATNLSGTITVTSTFQSIQDANAPHGTTQRGRIGCTIQNLSASNKMWVFFGPVANALTPTSLQLAAGASTTCSTGSGGVLTDQVSITGTAGDSFYASFQ